MFRSFLSPSSGSSNNNNSSSSTATGSSWGASSSSTTVVGSNPPLASFPELPFGVVASPYAASGRQPSSSSSSSSSSPSVAASAAPKLVSFTVGGVTYEGECKRQPLASRLLNGPIVFAPETRASGETEFEETYLLAEGKGTLYQVNPTTHEKGVRVYTGTWHRGLRDGEGDGLIVCDHYHGYCGQWYQNINTTNPEPLGKYKGGWKKGLLHGRGTLEVKGNVVEGEFQHDQPFNATGVCESIAGTKFSGSWFSGFFHGQITRIDDNGVRYCGDVKNNKKAGKGVETFTHTGGQYEGFWKDDKRHFCGTFTWPSGKIEEREYDLGTLVQTSSLSPTDAERELVRTRETNHTLTTTCEELTRQISLLKSKLETLESFENQLEELKASSTDLEKRAVSFKTDLETERDRNRCQICMDKNRDALLMPCCHFLYCTTCVNAHLARSRTCPACRTSVSGIMNCKLTL
ncbi:hypothetical protein Pelo_4173 [Pelomyxa schiedti]|nr:hypothetical protein Pelo_4173 [Pelomyxa schiedti]